MPSVGMGEIESYLSRICGVHKGVKESFVIRVLFNYTGYSEVYSLHSHLFLSLQSLREPPSVHTCLLPRAGCS